MPAPVVTRLAPQAPPSQPVFIPIPAANRTISRRSAQNRPAALSAYVVRDAKTHILNTLSVSVKRADRLMAITLRGEDGGHEQQIVDLEFLPSSPEHPVFVLGSCDTDGVVFLWFLYIPKDALGNEIELRLLKKYSFYSLRRSTAAYYTRIRLAGTPDDGTMVLVRNDGSNCRIVNFSCHVDQPEDTSKAPAITAPDPVLQLPAPEQPPTQLSAPTTSETPAFAAETPAFAAETPAFAAETPAFAAETPAFAAETPVVTAETPVVTAETPVVTAEMPVVTEDTRAIASETPVVAPETPLTTSDYPLKEQSRSVDPAVAKGLAAGAVAGAAAGATIGSLAHGSSERVIGEGLNDDRDIAGIGETLGTVEPSTLVEDADEDEEYFDAVERVTPPVEEHEQVYAEGLRDRAESVPVETIEETGGMSPYLDEDEDVITEEVIDEEAEFDEDAKVEEYEEDEEEVLEELEEVEEEEYEEYVEPEVERVYGEGLGNGVEPNHVPRY